MKLGSTKYIFKNELQKKHELGWAGRWRESIEGIFQANVNKEGQE